MKPKDIEFSLFSAAIGYNGPPFVMNIEHQLRRLVRAVPKESLKDVNHIAHEIYGVVPYQNHPGDIFISYRTWTLVVSDSW